ncbi:BrnT family toxin [Aureimonas pseudogalii]|uniref:BrnT family toxin n=1 Tax=Aureimonas pseudogalii TaxID=1744844 RepID=A0A7W6MM90_9HYPH|nr:BrnT family toxin [Aureimonas pseudogalii]MBB4000617.1 hypothetical protein [Aureimonas pseudogalii]
MKITFDQPKRMKNIAIHEGLDFADLDMAFFAGSVVIPAKAGRSMAIGPFGETIIAVVFSPLGSEGIAIVSMRRASRKERSLL